MDTVFWQMVAINLATPTLPFIFPLRLAITAAAVNTNPWWLVLLVANLAGGVGMLPVYVLARWKAADAWHTRCERYPVLQRLRRRYRSNMFMVQVLMNATPMPDIVSSGLAGCEQYPIWRFLLSQVIGRSFHNVPLILGGLLFADNPWFSRAIALLHHPMVWAIVISTAIIWWGVDRIRSRQTTGE